MNEETTAKLSLIVALVSLGAPVVTAFINVCYQLWIRRLDRKQREREERIKPIESIYIGYLSALGQIIASGSDARSDYGKYFPLILLYIPEDKRQPFLAMDGDILSLHKIQNVEDVYSQMISTVQTEIARLHTEHKRRKRKLRRSRPPLLPRSFQKEDGAKT